MRKEIHPKTYEATVTCACGYASKVLSTRGENIHTEICSQCHPFYTGNHRFVDTAGRIDRFRKKYANLQK